MNRLKELRKEKNISQKDLALKLKVAQNTVSNWENGVRDMDSSIVARLADFFQVTTDYLLGRNIPVVYNIAPAGNMAQVPIINRIRSGFISLAEEDILGYELTEIPFLHQTQGLRACEDMIGNITHKDELQNFFFLRINGDSMEPEIKEGDLVLVHKQEDVESGQLAVVLVNDELGTVKKIIKKENTIVLQAFNPIYPPRIFTNSELGQIRIIGRVIEVKRKL